MWLKRVMSEEGLTYQALGTRSGIPYQTIGTWAKGSRATKDPPSEKRLRQLAQGLRRPESEVFRAAGRHYPESGNQRVDRWISLVRDLSESEWWLAEQHLIALRQARHVGEDDEQAAE